MTLEVWKPVVGYEGLYRISSLRNVMSLQRFVKRGQSTRLLPSKLLTNYTQDGVNYKVTLSKEGKSKVYYLETLVKNAFGDAYIAPEKLVKVKTVNSPLNTSGARNLLSAWG
jgi:hypothetical protein